MQENNFEKQVREKMGELNMVPADAVWPKVFRSIDKRKGNRNLTGILLLLLLLTTGSIIFIMQAVRQGDTSIAKNKPGSKTTIAVQPSSGKGQEVIPQINSLHEDQLIDSRESIVNREGLTSKSPGSKRLKPMQQTTTAGKSFPATDQKDYNKTGNNVATRNPLYGPVTAPATEKKGVSYNKMSEVNPREQHATVSSTNNPSAEINTGIQQEESASKQDLQPLHQAEIAATPNLLIVNPILSSSVDLKTTPVIQEFARTNIPRGRKSNRWKAGINFSAGIAATRDGFLGVIGLGSGDANKSFDQLQSNVGSGGGPLTPGSAIAFYPPDLTPGAGFTLGVFFQKKITAKTAIQVGLDYTLATTNMRIGNRVDSSANFNQGSYFYRSGSSTKYTNQFHFIALPVAVNITIRQSSRLPLYLNTGITVAQLVHTNALEFAPLNGALYIDKKIFNKTQLSLNASLMLSLNGNATNQLLVGPQVNFGFTNMANAGFYKGRHYSFAGIQMKKTLGKR